MWTLALTRENLSSPSLFGCPPWKPPIESGVQLSSPRAGQWGAGPHARPTQSVLFRCLAQAGAARGSENGPVINFPAAGVGGAFDTSEAVFP